jgi:hypothetical protein
MVDNMDMTRVMAGAVFLSLSSDEQVSGVIRRADPVGLKTGAEVFALANEDALLMWAMARASRGLLHVHIGLC